MLTFMKDGGVKFVDEGSAAIPILEENGWVLVSESVTIDEPVLKPKKLKKHEIEKEGDDY